MRIFYIKILQETTAYLYTKNVKKILIVKIYKIREHELLVYIIALKSKYLYKNIKLLLIIIHIKLDFFQFF